MATSLLAMVAKRFKACTIQQGVVGLLAAWLLVGCASPSNLTLMPKPVLYQNGTIDPFAHLRPEHQTNRLRVFYATNRRPQHSKEGVRYGNALDASVKRGACGA